MMRHILREEDFVGMLPPRIREIGYAYFQAHAVRGLSVKPNGRCEARVLEFVAPERDAQSIHFTVIQRRVVGKRCSCWYFKGHSICRHLAAGFYAVAARTVPEGDERSLILKRRLSSYTRVPHIGLSAVEREAERGLLGNGSLSRLLQELGWEALRNILITATGLYDVDTALYRLRNMELNATAFSDEDFDGVVLQPKALRGVFHHDWFTILEAATEYSGDRRKLEDIYCFYIAAGNHGREDEFYVDLLRRLSGEEWPAIRAKTIKMAMKHADPFIFGSNRNRTLEYLLNTDHLTDEALAYCRTLDDEVLFGALENVGGTVALKHSDELAELLLPQVIERKSYSGWKLPSSLWQLKNEHHKHFMASVCHSVCGYNKLCDLAQEVQGRLLIVRQFLGEEEMRAAAQKVAVTFADDEDVQWLVKLLLKRLR